MRPSWRSHHCQCPAREAWTGIL
ncbi:hypothetical protein HBO26_00945 [Pseudomonas mandelii]|uniref:Uncharacterized protein n=1 Tax=Pseudomonas mandelii TaxID=75612 RepID=A0AB36CQF9_9PSED|nr:hypothetical protein [Pseudomonas mandelii]